MQLAPHIRAVEKVILPAHVYAFEFALPHKIFVEETHASRIAGPPLPWPSFEELRCQFGVITRRMQPGEAEHVELAAAVLCFEWSAPAIEAVEGVKSRGGGEVGIGLEIEARNRECLNRDRCKAANHRPKNEPMHIVASWAIESVVPIYDHLSRVCLYQGLVLLAFFRQQISAWFLLCFPSKGHRAEMIILACQ